MQDEPDVVTDYASLLRAQLEYKVGRFSPLPARLYHFSPGVSCDMHTLESNCVRTHRIENPRTETQALLLQSNGFLRCLLALILPSLAKPRKEEKDERIISLGLHIVRNLLAIKDAVVSMNASGQKEDLSHLQVCFSAFFLVSCTIPTQSRGDNIRPICFHSRIACSYLIRDSSTMTTTTS